MASPNTTHVLMRFADAFLSIEDTIEEHDAVIKKHGAVWMGKIGKPLGKQHILRIQTQVTAHIPSHLYLVQRLKGKYLASRGTIVNVSVTPPSKKEKDLIPTYYAERGILRQISLWFKLTSIERLESVALSQIRIASSGMPVPETLSKSMAALFIVHEGKGDDYYKYQD